MKYYKRCENHTSGVSIYRRHLGENHRENYEDYDAILIFVVKDDFYNY